MVERWNRTMKNKMWKMFTANNNTVYYDKLDDLVNEYNIAKHQYRSIKQKKIKEACILIYMVI